MFFLFIRLYYFLFFFFFFNDTATTEIYTLSLHDALPFSSTTPRSPVFSHPSCMTSSRLTRGLPWAGSVTYPANTAGPPITRTPTSPGAQSVQDPSAAMCTALICCPARTRPTDPVRSPPGGVKVVAQVASVRP